MTVLSPKMSIIILAVWVLMRSLTQNGPISLAIDLWRIRVFCQVHIIKLDDNLFCPSSLGMIDLCHGHWGFVQLINDVNTKDSSCLLAHIFGCVYRVFARKGI